MTTEQEENFNDVVEDAVKASQPARLYLKMKGSKHE